MREEEKLNKILEALEALETLSRLEKEFKGEAEEKEKKEKETNVDVSELFSKESSMHVSLKGDEENKGSETCVEFKGCKTLADQTMLVISALSAVTDNMSRKEKVEYLANISTMVVAGEHAGIFSSKPPTEDDEEE